MAISRTTHNQRSQIYGQIEIEEQAKQQTIKLANKMKSMKLKREREDEFILHLRIQNLLQFIHEVS